MKILIVNTSGMDYEGISTTIIQLFSAMDKTDMIIDLVSVKEVEPSLREQIISLGINIINIEYRTTKPLRYIFELTRHMRKNNYDLIHTHGSSATLAMELIAARAAGCKIRIAHSRNTQCDYKRADKLLRPLFNRLYTHGFSCGEAAGKWLFGKAPFTVINNGKDLDLFAYSMKTRDQIREKYQWENKILVGHVGNFNYQKNHVFLLKIFKELANLNSNYRFCLMGDGPEMESVKIQAAKYGLIDKILFTGRINYIPDMLQAMDLMIFPSRFEGLPNVVIEWQASGLPSLISDKITDECALTDLVHFYSLEKSPQDWAIYADSITLDNRESRSLQARCVLENAGYDIKYNARQLKNLYFSFVHNSSDGFTADDEKERKYD